MKAKGVAMRAPKPPSRPVTKNPEESKAKLVDKSNPWGVMDDSQYYIDLGGVSNFLKYR